MKVSIVECKDYNSVFNAVKKAIDDIGFNIPEGKKVLLKPNVLAAHTPEEAITTHPKVIEAVIKLLKEKNCEIIIGDSSGLAIDGGTKEALEKSGISKLAEKYKIKLINFESIPAKNIKDDKAVVYKNPEITGIVFDVDFVINLPKLKTHTLMRYTGAVKNLFGTIPGGQKQVLHALGKKQADFANILVDIYQNIKPKLNIMDGVIGLEGNGPGTGGTPKKTGLILASESAPCLDIVASEIIGFKPYEILTNKFCKERGFIDDIEIIGDKKTINYKKPVNVSFIPGFFVGWVMTQALMYPYAIHIKCVKCEICKKVCPVHAITMEPYPVINKKKCINCYCCHENCPHHAMDLKGSWIFSVIKGIKEKLTK